MHVPMVNVWLMKIELLKEKLKAMKGRVQLEFRFTSVVILVRLYP
jgi:hypothetical protein